MSNLLVLVHNGEIKVEYDRNKPLAGLQRRFLEKMDADMDKGFMMDDEHISSPDQTQRMQFVANHVVNSFLGDKEQMIAAGCAYLAKNVPDIKQICIDTTTSQHTIDLVFDEEFKNKIDVPLPLKIN